MIVQLAKGHLEKDLFHEAEKEVLKLIATNDVPRLRKSAGELLRSVVCALWSLLARACGCWSAVRCACVAIVLRPRSSMLPSCSVISSAGHLCELVLRSTKTEHRPVARVTTSIRGAPLQSYTARSVCAS